MFLTSGYHSSIRGLRPEIPSHVPERLARLLQDCWHEDPSQRPEFSDVSASIDIPLLQAGLVSNRILCFLMFFCCSINGRCSHLEVN
jgi:hypothetical protein